MSTLICTLRIPVHPDQISLDILINTMKEYSKAAQMAYNYRSIQLVHRAISMMGGDSIFIPYVAS